MTGCFWRVSSIPTVSTTALAPGYQGALHSDLLWVGTTFPVASQMSAPKHPQTLTNPKLKWSLCLPQTCSFSADLVPLKTETWNNAGLPLPPSTPNNPTVAGCRKAYILNRSHLLPYPSPLARPSVSSPALPPWPAECFLNQAEQQVSVDIQIPSPTPE